MVGWGKNHEPGGRNVGERLGELPVTHEELRSLVLDCLNQMPEDQFAHLYAAVARTAAVERKLVPDPNKAGDRHAYYALASKDAARVQDVVWDLIIEGVLRPGLRDGANDNLPFYHLTELGKAAVASTPASPYDPDGYLKRLKAALPSLDPVITTYLEESLKTFRIGCLLSSTVTLGCASEQAFLLLVEAYAKALKPSQQAKFEKATKGKMLKTQYDEFLKMLQGHLRGHLPRDLDADLDTTLLGVFSMIRNLRNDAGHPTGRFAPREVCNSNLHVFPSYLRKVYELIGWLNDQGPGSL